MALKSIKRVFIVIGIFIVFILFNIYFAGMIICYGPSKNARDLFITTFLETGNMKFVAKLFMNSEKINIIVDSNAMQDFNEEIDEGLINLNNNNDNDSKDIELIEIPGTNYFAKLLIIKDPSRVKLATIYDGAWKEYGKTLDVLVKNNNSIAGINGGLYEANGNKGGMPAGFVVKDGEIQFNEPYYAGLHLIGFDTNNLLRIIDMSGKSASDIEKEIKNNNIRDAVAFQEEKSDKNNHFVKLIINGEKREFNGTGSGANPRTAIGQRKDGSVLMLVTDGRGANGHIGATASDLIQILEKYEAINAANIDGGSSSCMYYNGKFEMTSTTLYYTNTSWKLPTAFIVTNSEVNHEV